jgi:hypothetical protein
MPSSSSPSQRADRADQVIACLDVVEQQRRKRQATPSVAARCHALRAYQAERLRRTHATLLADPSTRAAALFFMDELYGTQDFLERDAQFRRIVPTIVRLFSDQVVDTVAALAELHALTETLDTQMATSLDAGAPLDAASYRRAWCAASPPGSRERQLELVNQIGCSLMHYTTHPSLGRALRLMRLPAKAAGLTALQSFLERGFETFAALPDAAGFLDGILRRERAFAAEQTN